MIGSTIAKSNPQLVEDLQQKSLRLVSSTLPKLADSARQTGRSVKASVTDMASSAGDAIQQHMPSAGAVKTAGAALVSAAALETAQRGIVRLAMRRPLLFALGGLAIVGGIVLAARSRKSATPAADADNEIGEGSYKGARDYHDRTQSFLKTEGKQVLRRARQARKALDSDEGEALAAAESEGLRHARS